MKTPNPTSPTPTTHAGRKRTWIFLFSLLLVAGIVAGPRLLTTGGSEAPSVVFTGIDGQRLDLKSLRGRPVLINFWTTTCGFCTKERPELIKLYREFSDSGLEIIAVAMYYDLPNRVIELAKKSKIPYPVALDVTGEISHAFGDVFLTPTSFLISPKGEIVLRNIGILNFEKLRKTLATFTS